MKNNLNYLKKYMKRYQKQFSIALTFLILETIGDLTQPIIMSKIIDKGVKEGNIEYIWKLGGLMMLMTVLGALFAITRNIVSSKVSQNFGADLREDLYIKIQGFSFDLRDKIAIVPQKTLLFTGSIKENIRWGQEDASDEEVEKVTNISQAHEFIQSFNEGYNTYLGQGGVNLSGGQKQRISIARALIKKPAILILDDSSSAVDLITERKIKKGLNEYLSNTTTILIAQRITSVMDANKILVMDRGRIVGFGNHDKLMKSSNVYQDIYDYQFPF